MTLLAIRVWGDVILELVAQRRGLVLNPPVTIRRGSIFAWRERVPPQEAADETAHRKHVELIVNSSLCATARIDFVHEIFDPLSWRRLGEWLRERGHDPELVDEDIVPITHPMEAMMVENARTFIESSEPALLSDTITFFEPGVLRYLKTWFALDAPSELLVGPHEVIVPPQSIIDVIT